MECQQSTWAWSNLKFIFPLPTVCSIVRQNTIQWQYLCLLKLYFGILTVALNQGDYLLPCWRLLQRFFYIFRELWQTEYSSDCNSSFVRKRSICKSNIRLQGWRCWSNTRKSKILQHIGKKKEVFHSGQRFSKTFSSSNSKWVEHVIILKTSIAVNEPLRPWNCI